MSSLRGMGSDDAKDNLNDRSEARTRAVAFVASALLLLTTGGCQNELFGTYEEPWRVPPEKLREIANFDPQAETTQPPETLEDAARRILAEGPRRLDFPVRVDVTLADVRAKALAHNLDLKVAQIDPSIARAQVSEEEAKFEATFFADYTRNENNLLTNLEEGLPIASDSGDAGVNFPLATGGTFSASGLFLRSDPDAASLTDNDLWQSGIALSISQPLLRNAGIESNTASIRVARLQSQVADARTKLEAIRVLANADRAYWFLYAAWKELEVRQEQYQLAMAQLDQARNRVEAGDAAEIEVIRAESGVGSTIELIIVADNQLRLRIRDLKRIMNDPALPIDSMTALMPGTLPNPLGLTLNGDELAARAVADRMEMLELELQLAADATIIDLRRNEALPLFVVDYEYQVLGRNTSFGASASDIGDDDQYVLRARAEIPLGNEAARSRISQAVLTRLQRLATRDQRAQVIRQEVLNSLDNLENAWRRILAARLEVLLAARTYEAEKRQFEVGIRTSTDVLDASSRLADAQSREVAALAGWQIALVDLSFATGTLLGGSRIDWEKALPPPTVDPSGRPITPVTTAKAAPTEFAAPGPTSSAASATTTSSTPEAAAAAPPSVP